MYIIVSQFFFLGGGGEENDNNCYLNLSFFNDYGGEDGFWKWNLNI